MECVRHNASRSVYAALVLVVTAGFIWSYGRIDTTAPEYAKFDLHSYLAMARAMPHLAPGIWNPFCYRLLGPWLAGLFRGHAMLGFGCVMVAASLALTVGFYFYLLYHHFTLPVAAATACLLAANKALFGFLAFDYFQLDDLLSLVFLLAAIFALESRRWVLFAAALLLWITARETVFLILPPAVLYLYQAGRLRRDWPAFLAALVPAAVAFVAIRLWVHPGGGLSLHQAFVTYAARMLGSHALYHLIIGPFLPVSLLPLIFLGDTLALARGRVDLILLVALVYFSVTFGSDYERLVGPTFVAFYLLTALIFQRHFAARPVVFLIVVALGLAAGLEVNVVFAFTAHVRTIPIRYVALAAVTLLGISIRLLELLKSSQPSAGSNRIE